MAESDNTVGRSAEHASEAAKADVNRVAELVRPVTQQSGHGAGHAVEAPSLAARLGIAHPSPTLGDPVAVQVADIEKTWEEKEIERREKAGDTSGSGGNWTERARILPIEQQQEKENERER
jgi:hypothetical protein